MIIKDKAVYVYDIEIFINVFHAVVKNTETEEYIYLEISERRNDLTAIYNLFHCKERDYESSLFLDNDKMFCGYNNKHYDDVIINYIIDFYRILQKKTYFEITKSLYNLSCCIIAEGTQDKWKKWKYSNYFDSLDLLTMYFSQKLRVGLKEMQVTMQFPNVEEYDGDFSKPLPLTDYQTMIAYNKNDVDSTEELLMRSIKMIDLRLGIEDEYGINALSMDGVSIGKEILKTKYLEQTGLKWDDIKDLRSPCSMVELNKVILPIIEFRTPILQDLLKEMKTLTVSPGIDGWNKQFLFFGSVISIGVGGLHSVEEPNIYIPTDEEVIRDTDAASLYPSLLIEWGFAPKHLGQSFVDTYSKIKKERIEAKHNGNKIKNETLKLALNSATGLMQSEYSWMYSPEDVMRIRMNGQLLLLMLGERLILETGCKIINWNTDGVYLIIRKDKLDKYDEVVSEFEKISRLQFEYDEFEAFYQYAINDYFGVLKGYSEKKDPKLIKQKGMFITDVVLGKGMEPKIIPEAIIEYFLNGTNPREYVKNCKDLNKFVTYQKVGKQFDVFYNNKKLVHINRFYYSVNSPYLLKYDAERKQIININKQSGVTIVNRMLNNDIPKNINYDYYLKEIYKIINDMKHKQLTLFE